MANYELLLPKMGESVAEATIIKWLKNEGDSIEMDEPVLEIATDKVDSEVPSPVAGVLKKQNFKEGDVVQVGAAIAEIATEAEESAQPAKAPAPQAEKTVSAPVKAAAAEQTVSDIPRTGDGGRFYSPLVRNIAKEEGVSLAELENIEGSGAGGRVTKKDILSYLPNRGKFSAQQPATPATKSAPAAAPSSNGSAYQVPQAPAVQVGENDEIIEMDRMRKIIADHMVMSKHVSPHVTSFVEADVTNLVMWREKVKKEFEKREGEKLTFTPIFLEAIAQAIREFPMINISLSGNQIIKRKNINLGMAAALPSGNLIVPVIKNADQMNLLGLTRAVNDLSARARANKLKPEDIQGGTYTVSNVGTFGNVLGTPIINQPQVAIMALGAIRKKPAVIETPQGDTIGIRHMMFLSHSYDHRIVDGALGGSFVKRVADLLEAFDLNRQI